MSKVGKPSNGTTSLVLIEFSVAVVWLKTTSDDLF